MARGIMQPVRRLTRSKNNSKNNKRYSKNNKRYTPPPLSK